LAGGDNTVSLAGNRGVAAAGYDGEEIEVITDHIETDRISNEEVSNEVTVHTFDWYETDLPTAISERAKTPAVADIDVPGLDLIDHPQQHLPLTEREQEQFAELGRETAAVVETVAREVTPVMTERSAAGELACHLRKRGIAPLVVLVGSAERNQKYRHFTSKDVPLGDYVTLTVLGRRAGLHASLTRTVAFDPPEWLTDRHRSTSRVSATALRATQRDGRRGGNAESVFSAIQRAYKAVGFPDEWHAHHQGGPAGYRGREWFAHPDGKQPLVLPKAYAWNPTISGTKSEDTNLVTEEKIELLTETGDWPTMSVDPIGEGGAVTHHSILRR